MTRLPLLFFHICEMNFFHLCAGGNQREVARAKAAKKASDAKKGSKDAAPSQQKKERFCYIPYL
jgi:hypothetical protein